MSGLKRASVTLALALGLAGFPAGAWAGGGHGHGHGGHGHGHGHHGSHTSFVIGVGPWWGWGAPYYYGPRYYYPYPAYYPYPYPAYPAYPAPVYQQPAVSAEPPVYIERDAAPAASADYWYYCESSGAYYPDVESCAEPWVKVPPRAE